MYLEIIIVALLIGANAILAMAEFAVISAKLYRLDHRARRGDPGSKAALDLAKRSSRFLSTIQVGITLVGIIVGAFSGVTLTQPLADLLATLPLLAPYRQILAPAIIVLVITYFTLVFGELIPKRIGLANPEEVAARLARPLQVISALLYPAVRVLSFSTEGVLRIAGWQGTAEPLVTEEEIQLLIKQGTEAGVIEAGEETMIKKVIHLGDLRVSALMTPRPDIVAIEISAPEGHIWQIVREGGHNRFPVFRDTIDTVLGIVSVRDLLQEKITGKAIDLEHLLTPPLFVPESLPVLKMLEEFQKKGTKIALVVDEYSSITGLIAPHDIMEEIVGEIPEDYETPHPRAIQRADGSWVIDGMMRLDEFHELFPVGLLTGEEKRYYQTLGGFVMTYLGKIPEAGDHFIWRGLRFEVLVMDGSRVHQVQVTPQVPEGGGQERSSDTPG
ncbi:MAG: hemolysin family protein [Methanomicrobiales archaeon]|nr:hemolysin family protein [Methanomicrobiales archaeon]